jgi:Kelch motif
MLSKRFFLRSILGIVQGKRLVTKRWDRHPGRRGGSVRQTLTECHTLLETLEDRLMLTASLVLQGTPPAQATLPAAHPTFRLLNPETPTPSAQPATGAPQQQYLSEIDPQQMQAAYGVNLISFGSVQGTGKGQTIALIDAYNDPNIVADAQAFSTQFSLPQFNGAGEPTLQVLTQTGSSNLSGVPEQAPGNWDVEESLDVEWAHSIAPQANIILYEANSNSISNLVTADQTAASTPGVSAVSNSWSASEFSDETSLDSIFTTPNGHQGVTFTASTGDSGPPSGWPAYSPNVVAVGGTSLDLDTKGDYFAESAWGNLQYDGASSGGISEFESQPSYQAGKVNSISSTNRTVPDLSMDADPATGVPVLDTYFSGSYFDVGGTSLASPMTAALVAIANQGRVINGQGTLNGQTQTLPMLYSMSAANYHDITTGITNDAPFATNGYPASFGYDMATGLGSPIGNDFVLALAGDQQSSSPPPTVGAPPTLFDWTNNSGNSSAGLAPIYLGDAVATATSDTLSLAVSNGTLDFGSTFGLTFVSGSNNSESMTVQGSIASLNAALSNGLTYTAPLNYMGSDFVQISLHDASDGLTGWATINMTDLSVTGPAVLAVFPKVAAENHSTNLQNATLITDQGATATSDSLTLTVDNGTIALASTTGITFESGTNNSSSMTISGSLDNLSDAVFNASTGGIVYTPETNYIGSDWLQETLSNASDGLSDLGAILISVSSGPSATTPATTAEVAENTPYTYPTGAIKLSDGSATGYSDTLDLQVTHGTLTLATTSGLSITGGANNSSSISVNGTLASLQAAVNGLVYTPGSNFTGGDGLGIGLVNSIYVEAASALGTIEVSPAPSLTVPGAIGVTENSNYTFNGTISVSDPSAGSASQSLSLSVGDGKLTLGSTTGLTIASGFNNSSSMTVTGALANLNAALDGLVYAPNAGYTGSDSLSVSYEDLSDTFTASKSIPITVSPNSVPVVTAPSNANAVINTALSFNGTQAGVIAVSDTEGNSASEQLTLTVVDGTLALQTTTGLTVKGAGTSSLVLTGTLANLNTDLSTLVYTPNASYTGTDTLSLSDTDQTDGLTGTASTAINVLNWTLMTNPVPGSGDAGLTMLLPNGTLMVKGGGDSDSAIWYQVTPDSQGNYADGTWTQLASMNFGRLFFGSAVLPNGDVFVVGGQSATDKSNSNSAELYNPSTNVWTQLPNDPASQVGDVPTEVLPNGTVMVGTPNLDVTEAYNPVTNTWTQNSTPIFANVGPWAKLPGGGILSYDNSPTSSVQNQAEFYNTAQTNSTFWFWEGAGFGNLPNLTGQSQSYVLGPELLLPDGRVFVGGANGLTAFYDSTTGLWSPGPTLPSVMLNGTSTQLAIGNSAGAVMPNGDLLLALSPETNGGTPSGPTYLYEFNPNTNVYTNVTPPASLGFNTSLNSFVENMLVLPTGQVLITNFGGEPIIYTPQGNPDPDWQPSIFDFLNNGNGTYTLSGTQLNGPDEGASSGVDGQMAENYPIVRVTDTATGKVYYATTSNWSLVGVATGNLDETVNVVLPAALGNDPYSLVVIADGIASDSFNMPSVNAPLRQNAPAGTLTFSAADGNPILLSDPSKGNADSLLLIGEQGGTLNLASTAGLTFQGGSTNNSSYVSVTGSLSSLSAAINGLVYTAKPGFTGVEFLNVGLGNPSESESFGTGVNIQVGSAPFISAPQFLTANSQGEGGTVLNGAETVSLTDSVGTAEQLTLSAKFGTFELQSTSGLTSVSGQFGSTLVVTGPLSAINADLPTLVYFPLSNEESDTISISDTDTGDGETGTQSIIVGVALAPPSIAVQHVFFVSPPGTLAFTAGNAIQVADSVKNSTQQFYIWGFAGTFTLGVTTGLTVTGNGTSSLSVSGTLANLQDDLPSLTYTIGSNFTIDDQVSIYDEDLNDGLTQQNSIVILKTKPAVAAPVSATLNEDSNLSFSSSTGNAITGSDVWASGTSDNLTVSVAEGSLTLASTTGLSFQSGTTNNSSSISVTGTLANLNAALNGLIYVPNSGATGSDSLQISLYDNVDFEGGSASVPITVNEIAVPSITAPSTASLNEDATLTFSGGSLSVTDPQASGTSDSITLTDSDGQMTLGSTTGITVSTGSNGSSSMTVSGTLTNLNAALNGLVYVPNAGFYGTDSLEILVKDAPENVTVSTAVPISVIAPLPGLVAPSTEGLNENSKLTFPSGAFSLSDVNASGSSDSLTLSVSSGTLTLGSLSGLTFSSGSNGSSSMTVKGTLINLNAALNGLVYSPTTGYSGHDALKLSLSDSLDNLSASSSIAIAVDPFVTAPSSAGVLENGSYTFSSAAKDSLTLTDGAASSNSESMTLTVLHGKLTLATTTGLTFTSGANGSSSMVVKGTLANLNAALNGLVYNPAQFFTGNDTLTASIADSNDNLSGTTSVAISVAFKKISPAIATSPVVAPVASPAVSSDEQQDPSADQWAGVSAAVEVLYE